MLSLVLFAMLLKCFKYKTNILKENLIAHNFIPKKYLAQEMRLENWISHKDLYRAEKARPNLGGRSGRKLLTYQHTTYRPSGILFIKI